MHKDFATEMLDKLDAIVNADADEYQPRRHVMSANDDEGLFSHQHRDECRARCMFYAGALSLAAAWALLITTMFFVLATGFGHA